MRVSMRTFALSTILAILFVSLTAISPKVANAAESIPGLQWSQYQIPVANFMYTIRSSPTGSVTLGCNGTDLVSYDDAGNTVLLIDRTQSIDGVKNCITTPVVDNLGDVYGVYYGKIDSSNAWAYGPNLLAYSGNSLKWKYPVSCGSHEPQVAIGADGNIYVVTYVDGENGLRLIGLTPGVKTGQNLPEKIFDVEIPSDCTTQLFTHKNGIVLRGQSSAAGIYSYSYAGRDLGRPESKGDLWSMKVNDMGRIFTVDTVGGDPVINAYDAPQGTPSWTYYFVPGSSINSLHPAPGGGVVALVQEPVMVAPGIPASPPASNLKLIKVNDDGTKTSSDITLETTDTSTHGYVYEQTHVEVTTNNKLVVVRGYYRPTGLSWPAITPAVSVTVSDATTGLVEYDEVLAGDGPTGYLLDSSLSITNDAINFLASCQNGCLNYGRYLYAVSVPDVGMDFPRGDVLADVSSHTVPKKKYVAMGDSFSSGEGVPEFDYRTDDSGTNECHRSVSAYPEQLAKDPSLNLGFVKFAACSGAMTSNILDGGSGQYNEPSQLDLLAGDTGIVTLTIGGNDVGFVPYITGCVVQCGFGTPVYNAMLAGINSPSFKVLLKETYLDILNKAPDAKVFVADYPYISAASIGTCNGFDLSGARNIQVALNSVISSAVNEIRATNTNLHYVPTNYTGSPFAGKYLCTSDSYFNQFQPFNQSYSFHPNQKGAEAYGTVFKDYMNSI